METQTRFYSKHHRMKKFVFGALVIIAGGLLLAFNMNLLPESYRPIVFSWQSLLIALGIINVSNREGRVFGLILMAVGIFFMIPLIHGFPFNFAAAFWPVLLIFAGMLIIFKRSVTGRCREKIHEKIHKHGGPAGGFKLEDGFIEESNILSGNKRIIDPVEFKGGKISNIFGGTEIDLTRTTLAPGKNVLEISCIFGGVVLIIPADWNIQISIDTIAGGFADKRRYVNPAPDPDRVLVIKGSAVFGGGEIKS